MPDGRDTTEISVFSSLSALDQADWDACAGSDDPFVSYGFLNALEQSESVCPETGWAPQHIGIRDDAGRLLAVAPLYLKNHSYGEYVFDWGWADAYARAGGRYYPKLQCAVPFTPATGRRLLVRPDIQDCDALSMLLIKGMISLATQTGVSSLHITFPTHKEWDQLGHSGLLKRIGEQFHWKNRNYQSFDDFLGDLSSRKRKAIRKERKAVQDSGLKIHRLTGAKITDDHWDAFYRFYLDTSQKKWGNAYLNRDFFTLMHRAIGDKVMLILVEDEKATGLNRFVAGALNLVGGTTLYGRYWGSIADDKFLHFECCYYQAIDYAIERGLGWVEAGAQGPHKIQRGYLPRPTYSAHWIRDQGFSRAVENFVTEERQAIEDEIATLLTTHSPFKSGFLDDDPDFQRWIQKAPPSL